VFDALKGAFETDEVRGMLRSSGTAVAIATPTEFAAIMRADSEKLLKLANLIGLQAD
jgi:tripartite-type tricarboxylate transporter receptor subunit TctC